VKTGEEEPSSPPVDVFAEAKGSSTIRVTWKSPPRQDWNGLLEGFYVGFKVTDDSFQTFSHRTVQFGSFNNTFEHFIPGLKPKTQYTIVVKAFNSAGTGPPSHDVFARTYGGDFVESPKVHAMSITTDSIALHCQLPKSLDNEVHNSINGFIVHFRPDSSSVYKEVSLEASTSNDAGFVAKDLTPNTLYHFYVTASSSRGSEGDPSPLLSLRTRSTEVKTSTVSEKDDWSQSLLYSHDLNFFIPVVAVSIIMITLIFSYAYVKKAKLSSSIPAPIADYYATLRAGDPSVFVGTTRRYVDLDPSSQGNLMSGNVRFQLNPVTPMTPNHRPLPPNPNDNRKSLIPNFYDTSN
jgi:hypothetical protein